MKVDEIKSSSSTQKETIITLTPEDKEDLFTIYQIIDKEDEVIFRKLFTSKKDEGNNNKTTTDLVKLRLKILANEFDMKDEYLRYKGITVPDIGGDANLDISIGKYLSFSVHYGHPITIFKHHFNKYAQRLLNEAVSASTKADTAAVVLQEGIAHICLLTASSTILKQKVSINLPKKKTANDAAKFNLMISHFYKMIYDAMLQHFKFDELKMIIFCSPGFYAETLSKKVLQFAEQEQNLDILNNQEIFLIAHCSTGYLQGISEVLKNPIYNEKLEDTKFVKDVKLMDNFLEHLDIDDYLAWYGKAEIYKAAKMDAIETLLVTDKLLRSDDIAVREKYLDLLDQIENNGGKIVVFSTMHTSGDELDKLTGLACILKYPIRDLDEDIEELDEEYVGVGDSTRIA